MTKSTHTNMFEIQVEYPTHNQHWATFLYIFRYLSDSSPYDRCMPFKGLWEGSLSNTVHLRDLRNGGSVPSSPTRLYTNTFCACKIASVSLVSDPHHISHINEILELHNYCLIFHCYIISFYHSELFAIGT